MNQFLLWNKYPYLFFENIKKNNSRKTFYINIQDFKKQNKILTSYDNHFLKVFQNSKYFTGGIAADFLKTIVGPSVMTQAGDLHHQTRQALNPFFFSPDICKLKEIVCNSFFNEINFLSSKNFHGEKKYIYYFSSSVLLKTMAVFVFEQITPYELRELETIFDIWKKNLHHSSKLYTGSKNVKFYNPFFHANIRLINFIFDLIKKYRFQSTIVSYLLNQLGWAKERIVYELISILYFGHDTSAGHISWWVYHMNKNGFWNKNDHPLCDTFLTASLKETARISPMLPHISRVALTDVKIDSYLIKKGELVLPNIYLAHHNEQYYKQPHRFNPERFLEKNPPLSHYFPFGFSDRLCLGKMTSEIVNLQFAKLLIEHLNCQISTKKQKGVRNFIIVQPLFDSKIIGIRK